MKRLLAAALTVGASLSVGVPHAEAGGYDTPILYSARHMGMGGAAVSYVADPSAMFHNPAGLGHVKKASLMGNVSPLIGSINAPPLGNDTQIEAETTVAPFFLLGGAYRVHDYVTLGFGVYPVASAGGEYKYDSFGSEATTSTTLIFLEASPGIAFNLPGGFNLGVGYRITYATLDRFQGTEASPNLDFELQGTNFAGVRAGLQWAYELSADQKIQLGVSYRHRTDTTLEGDTAIVPVAATYTDASMKFVLPSRLISGARFDISDLGVAVDVEYGFNSQNKGYPLKGTDASGNDAEAANFFRWKNAITLRTGVEYRLVDGHVPVRAGYIWDQKTSNERFPTAFGTPPGDTHVGTVGTGWKTKDWQVNAAYAYRTVSGEVTQADIDAGIAEVGQECAFCSKTGTYELTMHGVYIDFSYDF